MCEASKPSGTSPSVQTIDLRCDHGHVFTDRFPLPMDMKAFGDRMLAIKCPTCGSKTIYIQHVGAVADRQDAP